VSAINLYERVYDGVLIHVLEICRDRSQDVCPRLDMHVFQPVLLAMSSGHVVVVIHVYVQAHLVHSVQH
jgi:hypothetical protein